MTSYIEMDDVTKRFGDVVALDHVNLRVTEPSIIGLVGKNGSGKTTLLRHVIGLQLPTSGTCRTLGQNASRLDSPELSRIGVAHQHDPLVGWMTAEALIGYVSGFYDTWDAALERHLIRQMEIDVRTPVGTMSPGNRQKLSLLLAVCHHPSLLLLDEPLADLDPIVRRDVVAELLDRFRSDDMVIVFSSHLLHDLERIADRIICVDHGRIVADAPLDDLKDAHGANLDELFRRLVGANP